MGFLDIFRKKKVDPILDGKLEQDWIVKEVISRVPGGCADCELTFSDSTGRVRRIEKWRCYMYSDTRVGAFPLYMEKRDYPNSNETPSSKVVHSAGKMKSRPIQKCLLT